MNDSLTVLAFYCIFYAQERLHCHSKCHALYLDSWNDERLTFGLSVFSRQLRDSPEEGAVVVVVVAGVQDVPVLQVGFGGNVPKMMGDNSRTVTWLK